MMVHVPSHCAFFKKSGYNHTFPTVAKFIFSLSRRLQEVSKNPVSYAFQTPAPELGFLAFPANGYVATPCLDNRPSPGALYWAKG